LLIQTQGPAEVLHAYLLPEQVQLLTDAAAPLPADDLLLQTAVFLASIAMWRERAADLPEIAGCAGYSSGVYAALAAGGWLSVDDALRLLFVAGRALSNLTLVPPGGMIAVIGLTEEKIHEALDGREPGFATISHFNHTRQHILAAELCHLNELETLMKQAGAMMIARLPANVPYHAPCTFAAVPIVSSFIDTLPFAQSAAPLLDTARVGWARVSSQVLIFLRDHFARAVLWAQAVADCLLTQEAELIEIGPGAGLTRMIRWLERSAPVRSIAEPDHRPPPPIGKHAGGAEGGEHARG